MLQEQFTDIIQLIRQSRSKAITAINTEMIFMRFLIILDNLNAVIIFSKCGKP